MKGDTMLMFETTAAPAGGVWTASHEVAPGTSSLVERPAEPELWIVVVGSALVEVASRMTRIEQGCSVLFDAMESHVAHNDSTDTPLWIVAARWSAAERGALEIATAA